MDKRDTDTFRIFTAAARPDLLAGAVMTYAMGAGIVHFLGDPVDWAMYWVGQCMVTLMQLSSAFLFAYFNFGAVMASLKPRRAPDAEDTAREDQPGPQNDLERERRLRLSFLQAGLVSLTIGAVFTVMLSLGGRTGVLTYFLIAVALAAMLSSALPPMNFSRAGFGEFITTLFLALLAPGLAYALQTGELHRLLTLLAFPLSALILACLMALSLESYQRARAAGQKNLMTQLGWQKGMQMHDLLILAAFLLFGGAALAGLPWALAWPAVLSLPVGLFQIWQMRQISSGARPHWRLLKWTAYGLAAVTVYLLALALWTS